MGKDASIKNLSVFCNRYLVISQLQGLFDRSKHIWPCQITTEIPLAPASVTTNNYLRVSNNKKTTTNNSSIFNVKNSPPFSLCIGQLNIPSTCRYTSGTFLLLLYIFHICIKYVMKCVQNILFIQNIVSLSIRQYWIEIDPGDIK